jgi:hypothetical protein
MISSLIKIYEGQLKIGTWDLAQGIGMQHRCLKGILERYLKKNEELRQLFPKKKQFTKRKGGQIEEYLLGEYETRLVFALLINHPNLPMGLNLFVLNIPGPEADYFKKLEEFFDEIKELQEFVEI